jgi:hypothetical protein
VRGGGVSEAVGAFYVDGGPDAGAVVVVEIEEGCCVEAGDVMLLYELDYYRTIYRKPVVYIPAIWRVGQSASGETAICSCALPCADALYAHDSRRNALSGAWSNRFIVAGPCSCD